MEILTNPWVVGIVAAVVGGLILYFVFGIGKPKPKHGPAKQVGSQAKEQTAPLTSTPYASSEIIPEKIFRYLDSLPPLQREAAAHNYDGIKVSWRVRLSNSFESGGKHYLMLASGGSLFPDIVCQADLAKYPELRITNEGQELSVEGIISSVHAGKIDLKDCTFKFGHE